MSAPTADVFCARKCSKCQETADPVEKQLSASAKGRAVNAVRAFCLSGMCADVRERSWLFCGGFLHCCGEEELTTSVASASSSETFQTENASKVGEEDLAFCRSAIGVLWYLILEISCATWRATSFPWRVILRLSAFGQQWIFVGLAWQVCLNAPYSATILRGGLRSGSEQLRRT